MRTTTSTTANVTQYGTIRATVSSDNAKSIPYIPNSFLFTCISPPESLISSCLFLPFMHTMIHNTRSTADAIVYGSISNINLPALIPARPYKYRFCGLPIGVNMLPRFAAMVWSVITGTIHLARTSSPAIPRTVSVIGTNVMSDTSFVINMLKKKHMNISTNVTARSEPIRFIMLFAMMPNIPCCENPATTVIRQNRIASVLKSM